VTPARTGGSSSAWAHHWCIAPDVDFLNHGSFGACPRVVLDHQTELRNELERQPVAFFMRRLEPLLDTARVSLARLIRAHPEDVVFVRNATWAVNSVLRSLPLAPGDELLVTDHVYNACRNVVEYVAGCSGARMRVAKVPFPLRAREEATRAVVEAVTPRTKLLLLDHVTSPTGLVLPVEDIARALADHPVRILVDGAHAVGQVDLDLHALGVHYYTSNCHKWLCSPKGSAFLWVRRDLQHEVRPAVLSHGANSTRVDRSRWLLEFDWAGTDDPTPWLCMPTAIDFLQGLLPGGLPALRAHNRALLLAGRAILCRALGCEAPAPEDMLAALATLPLPTGDPREDSCVTGTDPLGDALFARGIEVPIMRWPSDATRWIRISAQIHNSVDQYERLAEALTELTGGAARR
jgi:isopenicillin-N epimerase